MKSETAIQQYSNKVMEKQSFRDEVKLLCNNKVIEKQNFEWRKANYAV